MEYDGLFSRFVASSHMRTVDRPIVNGVCGSWFWAKTVPLKAYDMLPPFLFHPPRTAYSATFLKIEQGNILLLPPSIKQESPFAAALAERSPIYPRLSRCTSWFPAGENSLSYNICVIFTIYRIKFPSTFKLKTMVFTKFQDFYLFDRYKATDIYPGHLYVCSVFMWVLICLILHS